MRGGTGVAVGRRKMEWPMALDLFVWAEQVFLSGGAQRGSPFTVRWGAASFALTRTCRCCDMSANGHSHGVF